MEFISTKNMTNDNAPEGQVLVQYLEPSWGGWSVEFAIGYYDNPNDYENGEGEGWKHWTTEKTINVLAYCTLPELIKTELTKLNQKSFLSKYGSFHPHLGNAGKL